QWWPGASPPGPPPPPPPPRAALPGAVRVPGPPAADDGIWRPAAPVLAPAPPPGVICPDRNGYLLTEAAPEPPPCPPPGWFGAFEIGVVSPLFRNRLVAPVNVAGFTDLVAVPPAPPHLP